jgi:molybdopterin-containing oxidoreductase family molybdopterin binding subunit
MVEPNDCGDDRYETICLKGISEVQHIYGEGRVQTPLKRTGERGSGEFKAVSWDEALDDIVKQTQDIQDKHGKDALMVCTTSEADFPFLAAMFGARGGGLDGIDVGIGNGLDPSTGLGAGYAMSAPEARDWTRSKLVLTVGSNYCESSLPTARLFFEAMDAGAKTVTVDPHFSTTASKSNEWIPIEPGTDAALFLGMSSHIIDNELYDEEFMKLHSSYPFLVDKKTGKLLRDHEPVKVLDEDGEEVDETGDQNSFMVVDSASGAVVAHNSTEDPSLHASVEVNGSEACTVFDLLCENQKQYDLSWASKITGIEEDKIATLAEEYAEGPSALCLGWGGNDKMSNADVAGHAAAVLTAITGNIGKPGAGVGVYVGASYNCHSATLGSWSLPDDMTTASADVDFYDLPDKENNVHAAIFAGDFIAQHLANMSKTQEWAKTLDLIVTIDPYFTEGGKWADYILPSTTRFEYDEDYGNVKSGYSQIVIQEKVLDPLFEAKTDLTIQREFARRLGVEDALPKSAKERVDAILSTSSDEDVAALTIEQIAANSGVWPVAGRDEIRPALTDYEFATTSGRMEVYYDDLVDYDQQLPKWEPCVEIGDDAVRAKHPLQLSNVRTRFRIHNQFNDSVWLKQYYEPTIAINPKDLDEKGIKTGDTVEVSNDRGSFKVRVHANESIRPGSARLYEAATADYTKGGNMQSVTNDKMIKRGAALMCGPVIPFSDTLVDVKKA